MQQKAIDPCKVAVYIRWSTDDQGEGTTLEVQREGCRHYMLSQGWAFAEDLVFIDDGYSGGSLDRPAMVALRAAVGAGRVDCVVVFKLDRLSRSVVDTVHLVLEEWDGRCHVKSAREPIDTASHAGKMFFYMLVSYAEWERAVIRERTFSGKLRRAEEGRNPGFRAPYGYTSAGGAFAPEPAEAAVVKRIFLLYRHGAGVTAIAHRLNGEGLRFREGRLWHASTIKKILANPIYCGDLQYGRRTRNPSRGKREGEAYYLVGQPRVIRRDAVPAIVSREEWDLVQAARAERPGAGKGQSGRAFSSGHLLTGIARCLCGGAIVGYRGGGKAEVYYRCSAGRQKGSGACACGYIRQSAIDDMVLATLQQEFGDQVARERCTEKARAEARAAMQRAQEGMAGAQRAIARIAEQESRIRRMFREGGLTVAEYRELRADMAAERSDQQTRLQQLQSAAAEAEGSLLLTQREVELFGRIQELRSLPPEQQKHLLRHFAAAITLYRRQGSSEIVCDMLWRWAETRAAESLQTVLTQP